MNTQLFFERAYSIKLDPWTSLTSVHNRFFDSDFCTNDHFTLKILANTFGTSKIRLKQTFNLSNKNISLNDDIRLCLPIQSDSTLFARIKNNNIKLQYEKGIDVWRGLVYDLYGSTTISKNASPGNFQFGCLFLARQYFCDNMFRLTANNVRWYHKTMLNIQNYRFGLVGVMDFSNSNFLKKDILLGYCYKKIEAYALATQAWKQQIYQQQSFSNYKVSLIYREDEQRTVGFEATVGKDLRSVQQICGVTERIYGGRNRMKVKLNNRLLFNFLWQTKWNDHLISSIGFQIPIMRQYKQYSSKLGIKLQINV